MVKHAILLASEKWCEEASKGKIKFYHFIKPRRRSIRALGKGSVCVVLTKKTREKPSRFYGEFTVVSVRKVGADEWNDLINKGLIFSEEQERLRRGQERWIIEFEEFREYEVKVAKEELTDVRTRTSRRPISDWVITGLSYIDEHALQAIRSRAGRIISHRSIVDMIKEIGEILGFRVKTEENTPDQVHRLDITWRDHPAHSPLKVWEVQTSGNVVLALARLRHAFDIWHPELYLVVADARTRERAENIVRPQIKGAFAEIEKFLTILGADEIVDLYNSLRPHRDIISKLVRKYSIHS
jgi:hypothetical protein